jgi:hypothetical protein
MEISCNHFLEVRSDHYSGCLVVGARSCEGFDESGRVRHDTGLLPVLEQREHTTINKREVQMVYNEILRPTPETQERIYRVSSVTWRTNGRQYRLRLIHYGIKVSFNAAIWGLRNAWFVNVARLPKPDAPMPGQPHIDLWLTVPDGGRAGWRKTSLSCHERLMTTDPFKQVLMPWTAERLDK